MSAPTFFYSRTGVNSFFTCLAFFGVVFFTSASHANTCFDMFVKRSNEEAVDLPLSKEQEDILRSHPLSQLLASGQVSRIDVSPLIARTKIIIEGENIQARYLKSLLIKAGFRGVLGAEAPPATPSRGTVALEVQDTAQFGNQKPPSDVLIEMSDIKMANGTSKKPQRKARGRYNLPLKKKIGHLYINDPFAVHSEKNKLAYFDVAQRMFELGADTIFLSSNNITSLEHFLSRTDFLPRAREMFDVITSLSELAAQTSPQPLGRRTLVINDTKGIMPEVHSFSDFVVVVGPKNFFEALYAGVPTYFLMNGTLRGTYDESAMQKMIEGGQAFSNFLHVRSVDELVTKELQPSRTYDYGLFRSLLDLIYDKIQNQIQEW